MQLTMQLIAFDAREQSDAEAPAAPTWHYVAYNAFH